MRTLKGFIFAIVLGLGVPAIVNAQAQPPDARRDPAPVADRAGDRDWGWLGLLGLVGLFGLKRRVTVHAHDRDRLAAAAHR